MRIAYLCLQATREGQASRSHVHEIIRGLRGRRCEVKLYEPDYVTTGSEPSAFGRLVEFVKVQWRLWRAKPSDVLYVRWHFGTWPMAMIAKWQGTPVIQEVNGPYNDLFVAWPWTRRLSWLFKAVMRLQLRRADAVIVVTPQLVDWVKKEAGHDRIHIVSNGANTQRFRPGLRRPRGVELPDSYVVFFGALARWQGVDVLLNAVAAEAWPREIGLVVVGDGVDAKKVRTAAARMKRIMYFGTRPQRQLAKIIANSRASLSPKVGDWNATGLFPLKLFESLACGVPVIVSDFPGMADLVREHQCGLVVPPEDANALANAVAQIANNLELAAEMGGRGRHAVETEHSWDKQAEKTLTVIKSIATSVSAGERRSPS